jgi:RimJ/RimL family protein N-acetyltransferase
LHENNFQIRYNACHERGWSDTYLIEYKGTGVGYGAIKGSESIKNRDALFEFYLIPTYRHLYSVAFNDLLHVADFRFIETQSNNQPLTALLYQNCYGIRAEAILFEEGTTTFFTREGAFFRSRRANDKVFEHKHEPEGEYVLEWNNEVIATGGFALHYNHPFADLYIEVDELYHRKGFGTFLVQELKRECYLNGRVPAARCNIYNTASKATLLKAGFKIAGYMLSGTVYHELGNKHSDRKNNR